MLKIVPLYSFNLGVTLCHAVTVCNKKVDPNAGLQRQSEKSKNSFIAGIHKKYKTGMPHMNKEET